MRISRINLSNIFNCFIFIIDYALKSWTAWNWSKPLFSKTKMPSFWELVLNWLLIIKFQMFFIWVKLPRSRLQPFTRYYIFLDFKFEFSEFRPFLSKNIVFFREFHQKFLAIVVNKIRQHILQYVDV